MPEDSKKSHDKKKVPREQRKPRQRHQQSGAEKKTDKTAEEPNNTPKVTVPQKPAYEAPPPEFYKNLKRETDDILKITEEENTKYKKKEIQSNWSKYEMPIDSYEEIEEQENLGADYEKLIQAPLSIGGHFQFKHEKSWDMNTGPSLYDKYFDINMEDLNIALCSIPFYERNSIGESNFSQTDILTMNNRATRFKQKYYNDKSYSTPETEAQDKIFMHLRESMEDSGEREKESSNDIKINYDNDRKTIAETENTLDVEKSMNFEFKTEMKAEPPNVDNEIIMENVSNHEPIKNTIELNIDKKVDNTEHDGFFYGDTKKLSKEEEEPEVEKDVMPSSDNLGYYTENMPVVDTDTTPPVDARVTATAPKVISTVTKTDPAPVVVKVAAGSAVEIKKTPVIESPEDLEKWLDDFLDG